MRYYQFHIGDYKSHTHHLSPIEDIAYRRLLDYCYLHEAPIMYGSCTKDGGFDVTEIARLIGMRDYEQEVRIVLKEFFIDDGKSLQSPRVSKEIAEFKRASALSSWGAFVRENKELSQIADKEAFVNKHLDGTHIDYIESLKAINDPSMMPPSSNDICTHDATNNHNPLPNNQLNTNPVVSTTNPSSKNEDGIPDCPHQKILAIYKRALPELPYPKDWSGSRASALKSRWVWVIKNGNLTEKTEEFGLDYFRRMFDYIAQSDFLTGRSGAFSPRRRAAMSKGSVGN